MMINTPSAPGGAAAAPSALPGVAMGDAAFAAVPSPTEGGPADAAGLPALFSRMLDFAGLAMPADTPAAEAGDGLAADDAADTGTEDVGAGADMPLAAMMAALPFGMLPAARPQPAAAVASMPEPASNTERGAVLPASAADSARQQAAADAMTAALAASSPIAARLLQAALPATKEAAVPLAGGDARQSVASANGGGATAAPAATTATAGVLAAQDSAAQSGKDGQSGQPQAEGQASFRGIMAATPPASGASASADTVQLAGTPEQWQQPLRAALGDRLQLTLQKGNDQAVNQAVIRLEPPNLGSIEISIRQSAGALHVSMSATNSEVVRQLNAVGDSMRQDLSQRQQGDVAVTVSQASSRSLADSEGRGRQPEREAEQQREQRGPGRALNEGDDTNTTFAMLRE